MRLLIDHATVLVARLGAVSGQVIVAGQASWGRWRPPLVRVVLLVRHRCSTRREILDASAWSRDIPILSFPTRRSGTALATCRRKPIHSSPWCGAQTALVPLHHIACSACVLPRIRRDRRQCATPSSVATPTGRGCSRQAQLTCTVSWVTAAACNLPCKEVFRVLPSTRPRGCPSTGAALPARGGCDEPSAHISASRHRFGACRSHGHDRRRKIGGRCPRACPHESAAASAAHTRSLANGDAGHYAKLCRNHLHCYFADDEAPTCC